MYEAFRVLRKFQWRGNVYAPPGFCKCECNQDEARRTLNHCSGRVATACQCPDAAYCSCSIPQERYGGDIWIVENGNPRKEYILQQRFAVYDISIPPGDELVKNPAFQRLIIDPRLQPPVGAGR